MDGIAPGDGRRLPVERFLQSGIDARRTLVVPARTRRLGDPGEAHHRTGDADHADAAIAQFEIGLRAFQQIGGDGEDLVAQPLARVVQRRRQGDRAAARHRAEPDRDRGGVGKRDHDIVGRDLPDIRCHLREDRLHALALRTGAGCDVDLAGRVDADKGALERPDAGSLDVAADAEPEMAALPARLALAQAERRDAAHRIERLFQAPG